MAERVARRPRPSDHATAPLDAWAAKARPRCAPEVAAFIAKLEQDRAAVEAALVLPYSQGPTEGQLTRLKGA